MPFTVSHALYALPLRYIRASFLSATGLILGSMSPDLEYFIHLEPYRSIGHTWQGFLLQALSLCIVLAAIFHIIVKEPLAAHMPSVGGLNERCLALFQSEQLTGWRSWAGFLVSVTLGFISHIVLDEFTHAHSSLANYIPWIWQDRLFGLPLYKLLQYSLSIFGLLALLLWVMYALFTIRTNTDQQQQRTAGQKLTYWSIVACTSIVTTVVKLLLSADEGNVLGIIFVAPISGFILGIIAASLRDKLQLRAAR